MAARAAKPFVVAATWPFGAAAATEAGRLIASDAAADLTSALVAGAGVVEDDPATGGYFVGRGGLPNADGDIQLDGAVMRGTDCGFGAAVAVRGHARVAALALEVLQHSRHSVLCGAGAEAFALERGWTPENLHTPESLAKLAAFRRDASSVNTGFPGTTAHDTLGCVGCDGAGHVAAVTTTSGMSFKHAGRVGDSPLPGAGLFADDAAGAAAATGDGDKMLRFAPAYAAVQRMGQGDTPTQACRRVIADIRARLASCGQPMFEMSLVAVNVAGDVGAASTLDAWTDHLTHKPYAGFPYAVCRPSPSDPAQLLTTIEIATNE